MTNVEQKQRRRFFRLPYPAASRPPFTVQNGGAPRSYKVLEIAENSLVIEQKPDEILPKGEVMVGEVVFHDLSSERIIGEVFRHAEHGVVLLLSKGISLRHVISEQVFVKSQYPMFLRRK